jgi:predicted NUDIX family NTP pyrophosphohydrolase
MHWNAPLARVTAMPKPSAGILLYRRRSGKFEFLLVHPGGPIYARKDDGYWSIPKGEYAPDEDKLAAAQREFEEELGFCVPAAGDDAYVQLPQIRQKSGKVVDAWAVEGDCDPTNIKSNTFTMEWPPRSGNQREFPEIDRAAWFSLDEAVAKINEAQVPLLRELVRKMS